MKFRKCFVLLVELMVVINSSYLTTMASSTTVSTSAPRLTMTVPITTATQTTTALPTKITVSSKKVIPTTTMLITKSTATTKTMPTKKTIPTKKTMPTTKMIPTTKTTNAVPNTGLAAKGRFTESSDFQPNGTQPKITRTKIRIVPRTNKKIPKIRIVTRTNKKIPKIRIVTSRKTTIRTASRHHKKPFIDEWELIIFLLVVLLIALILAVANPAYTFYQKRKSARSHYNSTSEPEGVDVEVRFSTADEELDFEMQSENSSYSMSIVI